MYRGHINSFLHRYGLSRFSHYELLLQLEKCSLHRQVEQKMRYF